MEKARIHNMLFPEGKRKALTLSYDDGVLQDKVLIDLMNSFGVKGTFNLNSETIGRVADYTESGKTVAVSTVPKEEIAVVYKGHEISTHASEHSSLVGIGAKAAVEILEDRSYFEAIISKPILGHAFPFGLYDKAVLQMLDSIGIKYARTVESTHSFELPLNFLPWHPTCHHQDPQLMELVQMFCEEETLFSTPKLFYLWGHSYEFDLYDNWSTIKMFFEYISKYKDTIWMATNMDIVHYVNAFRQLIYTVDCKKVYNPTGITLWLDVNEQQVKVPSNSIVRLS